MSKDALFTVGDRIIDCEEIHVITGIKGDFIQFHPLIITDENRTLTDSIPIINLKKAGIRRLMSKKEVDLLLKSLRHQIPLEFPINSSKNANLKEFLYSNNPSVTAQLIEYLLQRQNTPLYTRADDLIFNQALNHLSNEISTVMKISPNKAKEKILSSFKKHYHYKK